MLKTSLRDRGSKHWAWAGVRTCTESKQAAVLPLYVELLRVRIEGWITIGGCQNDKNTVTLLHSLAGHMSILSKVAARVLRRRIVAKNLLDDQVKKTWIAWLHTFGIASGPLKKQELLIVPWHIDWSERKRHVAGALGAALAGRLFELQWLERHPSSRAVRLTTDGKTGMEQAFGLCL